MAGADFYVEAIALQTDGKIVVGGWFTAFNGIPRGGIARLNTDGSLDATFLIGMPGTDGRVTCLAIQNDGKVLLGGTFNYVNGSRRRYFARLNADGSLDEAFMSGSFLSGPDGTPSTIRLHSDGRIVVCGGFQGFNDQPRGGLAQPTPG